MAASINWQALEELRTRFLDKSAESKAHDYWDSTDILELYDRTFAQRIRWKWQAVLDELSCKQGLELPTNPKILDWGCGSGVAARTFLSYAGILEISNPEILLFDRSNKALHFAQDKLRQEFAGIKSRTWITAQEQPDILLLSHVLNEIDDTQLQQLKQLVLQSALTIWVEPGTYDISRKLLECREFFKDHLHILAPCPQEDTCPLKQEKNKKDWCHQFARPPTEVFQSSFWAGFSKQLKIDLRSLPVSFLALAKENAPLAPVPNRMIGKPKKYKPYQAVMVCTQTGELETLKIAKRTHPDLYKKLDDPDFCTHLELEVY